MQSLLLWERFLIQLKRKRLESVKFSTICMIGQFRVKDIGEHQFQLSTVIKMESCLFQRKTFLLNFHMMSIMLLTGKRHLQQIVNGLMSLVPNVGETQLAIQKHLILFLIHLGISLDSCHRTTIMVHLSLVLKKMLCQLMFILGEQSTHLVIHYIQGSLQSFSMILV